VRCRRDELVSHGNGFRVIAPFPYSYIPVDTSLAGAMRDPVPCIY